MSGESKPAEAMRLAAARLAEHAAIAHRQARALEQPSGFGETADRLNREGADERRRSGDIDSMHAKTLRTLIREGAV